MAAAALVGVALVACAVVPVGAGAVIPVAEGQSLYESYAAARLPMEPPLVLAGEWTGQAPDGSSVRVSLRVERGVIRGAAELGRDVHGTETSGPLVRPRMTSAGRVAFTVGNGACERDQAQGAMTLLSPSTAELVVSRSGGARVLIRLVRTATHRG
jgi:hypothetical protein